MELDFSPVWTGWRDLLSWELWYTRYFDPTFGGAVQPGIRNVNQSEVDLTGYAFLDGERHQSPVVSVFRSQHRWAGLEWVAAQRSFLPVICQI